jgi:Flp pilus assembly protein TadB
MNMDWDALFNSALIFLINNLKVWIIIGIAALFLALFIGLHKFLTWTLLRHNNVGRLDSYQEGRLLKRAEKKLAEMYPRPYRHLSELLELLDLRLQPGTMIFTTLGLWILGMLSGSWLFQSTKGIILFGILLGAIPYCVLRVLLIRKQLQTRNDFLPAVELFYQSTLVAGGRQIRAALQRTVDEKRLVGPKQQVFEQLYRNLSVRDDDDASLRIFSQSLGHVWADYFVNILRAGLQEGHPIHENLRDLISDMRRSRRQNQIERNKLLEIRIASFTPILFLALFIGINFKFNPENAWRYYIADPAGRDMILNSMIMIFASFVIGFWLSRKKI